AWVLNTTWKSVGAVQSPGDDAGVSGPATSHWVTVNGTVRADRFGNVAVWISKFPKTPRWSPTRMWIVRSGYSSALTWFQKPPAQIVTRVLSPSGVRLIVCARSSAISPSPVRDWRTCSLVVVATSSGVGIVVRSETTARCTCIPGCSKHTKLYRPTGAVTSTKKCGWLVGLENCNPLFTTEVPSNAHGFSDAPQLGSEGAPTAGFRSTSSSSPPTATSGTSTPHGYVAGLTGPPGPWLMARQASAFPAGRVAAG